MKMESPKSWETVPKTEATLFNSASKGWEGIRDQVLEVEKSVFGEQSFDEAYLQGLFENPDNIIVLLKKDGGVIGFSCAIPDRDEQDAVYIETTEIAPAEQNKRHVVLLMQLLEEEARQRGYKFITRHAAMGNGYAHKIHKNYGDRILKSYDNNSEYGLQRYFKISLEK